MKIIALLLSVFSAQIFAQEYSAQDTVRLELKDGSTLFGTILSEDSLFIYFSTLSHIPVTIPHKEILWKTKASEITQHRKAADTTTLADDPNNSRLLLFPTGRPLKKGTGYIAVHEVIFPSLAYGITDFLSIAGGAPFYPLYQSQLFYLSPKLTLINSSRFSFSLGATWANLSSSLQTITYGISTIGSEKFSFSLGIGSLGTRTNYSFFIFGAELHVLKTLKFLTENWLQNENGLSFFGIRFFKNNFSSDIGFVRPFRQLYTNRTSYLPWLVVAYNFGTSPVGDYSLRETVKEYLPAQFRFSASYDIGISKGNKELEYSYHDLQPGGNFSSNSLYTEYRNGITLQAEKIFSSHSAAGITLSTIEGITKTPAYDGPQPILFNGASYFDYYVFLKQEFSIISALLHYQYRFEYPVETSRTSVALGGAVGMSNITSQWMGSIYGFDNYPMKKTSKRQTNPLTGMVSGTIEQQLTRYFSLAVRASYVYIAPVKSLNPTLNIGTREDYAVYPPVEKPITIEIPESEINYSHSKIGIVLEVHW